MSGKPVTLKEVKAALKPLMDLLGNLAGNLNGQLAELTVQLTAVSAKVDAMSVSGPAAKKPAPKVEGQGQGRH